MLKIYPKSFNKRSTNLLKVLVRNESIDYKNLSFKTVFYDETNDRSHEINLLKKFGTLYGLLKNLLTSKINTTNPNIDLTGFIAHLLMGYYIKDFSLKETEVSKENSNSCQSKA